MTQTEYLFVGGHVDNLDDGRVVAPLQKVKLDAEAVKGEHAARMLRDGLLLEVKRPAAPAAAKKEGEVT